MTMQPGTAGLIGDETPEAQTKALFLDCLALVERLHRRLLDVLKDHLDREGCSDLNPVQALLVYNIGEHEMTAGELKSRGYYQGSNVSYNLKKLVEMGYIDHQRAEHDRRAVRISLTDRGYKIRKLIDSMYLEQLDELLQDGLINSDEMIALRRNLRNLERFWSDRLRFAI
ncbi:transcriptional regulator [Iodidimonas nitroreducens]|uniref:Transcriptional regulator n=2 Tax=Iodidimonas TaxID=2066486 RepID=A0A5A7NAF8_9PROT|nr:MULTISPECIES: winged helix DNA-binding protein [Iodidimonas]GAK33345.1 exopolysaccharide II synthesis transcriptional activator ExpG [alpha proteobacterium Q-1]GER05373.1 transcriptional regulator [Iodidimonas nitroreducens]